MTIAFVCHSREVGGAELHLEGLMADLQEKGLRHPVLICRTDAALDGWIDGIMARGIAVHRLDLATPADFRRLVGRLRAAELVHLMLAYPVGKYQLASAIAARVARRSLVVTHHLALDIRDIALPSWRRRLWEMLFRRYGRLARRHIAVSESGRELLVGRYGFPRQSVEVIYTGVDAARFRPLAPAERDEIRRAAGLRIFGENWDPQTSVVTTVARLTMQKGLDDLVTAAATVAPVRPAVRFLIVGDGERRAELTDRIEVSGLSTRIHLAGALPPAEVSRLLAASDLFVLPSHFEGIPQALLEAMASGCPVIATAVGGIPEVIPDASVGILVPPRRWAALAETIMRLLDRPAEGAAIGAAARRRVIERFDRQRGFDRTVALYDRLADRRA